MSFRRPEYRDRHNALVRVMAVSASAFLLIVSIMFSKDGFNMNLPGFAWIGIGMGIVVTILEFVWNEGGGANLLRVNITIAILCMIAYAYGIYTNFEGLMRAMSIDWATLDADPLAGIFPGALAILLEVTPEALFVWALDLEGQGTRDVLGNILGAFQNYSGQAFGRNQMSDGPRGGGRPDPRFRGRTHNSED